MPRYYEYFTMEGAPGAGGTTWGPRLLTIKTKLDNIRTETILRPLSTTTETGINGGFFAADDGYDEPPTQGRSICYNKYDDGDEVTYSGRTLPEIYEYNGTSSNQKSRKTAVIYEDSNGNTKAAYMYARNLDDVLDRYDNVTNVIGGTSFNSADWSTTAYYGPAPRTVFAWKGSYAYLIVVPDAISVPWLKESLEYVGLDPTNAIVLDGSGSSCIQVHDDDNGLDEDFSFYGEDRHLFNIIRVNKDY
ncbi:hypothetical protein EDM57_15560 [Brevibacillus gelatini]|uniref:Phosphodiester glycosidase domain-containing protein n=1 Tax=Brevibacillus gelatini TaxID=1655277 RepID=A0A3M8AV84_9BACL|nr:hypothetical protein [Brevibacillus gelatini]RNB55050.1 hypothetical protein EDM57_15560 [Brevibacillus gelatini]